MTNVKKLWLFLAFLLFVSFGVLIWSGNQIYQQAPPMPEKVLTSDGQLLYSRAEIEKGRQVWQSFGGMQLGSIWGHGGYVAPDWSADWMHRELMALLNLWANRDYGVESFELANAEQQDALEDRLKSLVRKNTSHHDTRVITLRWDRRQARHPVAEQ